MYRPEESAEGAVLCLSTDPSRVAMAALGAIHGSREVHLHPPPISNPDAAPAPPFRAVLLRPDGSSELLCRASRPDLLDALVYAFIARTLDAKLANGTRILTYADEWNVARQWHYDSAREPGRRWSERKGR